MGDDGFSWYPLPHRGPGDGVRGRAGSQSSPAVVTGHPVVMDVRSAVVDCGLYEGGERRGEQIELETALRQADECQGGFV